VAQQPARAAGAIALVEASIRDHGWGIAECAGRARGTGLQTPRRNQIGALAPSVRYGTDSRFKSQRVAEDYRDGRRSLTKCTRRRADRRFDNSGSAGLWIRLSG